MLFKDPNHLIGVDIRAHDIVAVELVGTGKRCRLKQIGQTTLPNVATGGGVVDDPVLIADALTTLFSDIKFGTRNVALSISGFDVTVKNLPIKRLDPTLLHNRVLRTAEQYVPYPLTRMYLDYMVLGNSVNQPGQMDVLMVAAPKALVNKQVKAVKMADLVPVIVDVAPLSAANCYTFNDGATTPMAVLLGVDTTSAAITVVHHGLLRFTRHVEMDFATHVDASELAKVLYETTDRLLESDLPQDVERVYLYGSIPQPAILKNELAREMDISVELLNPFGNITVPSKLMTVGNDALIGPQSAIGVGLALRKGVS